jgi:hypothetical protein
MSDNQKKPEDVFSRNTDMGKSEEERRIERDIQRERDPVYQKYNAFSENTDYDEETGGDHVSDIYRHEIEQRKWRLQKSEEAKKKQGKK